MGWVCKGGSERERKSTFAIVVALLWCLISSLEHGDYQSFVTLDARHALRKQFPMSRR